MTDLTVDAFLRFKSERARAEFAEAPARLREFAFAFALEARTRHGILPTVTRVREDAPSQATRVHAVGRALDFRDEYATASGTSRLFAPADAAALADWMNATHPRKDGKVRLLHHAVPGSTAHFHLQIAYDELTPSERASGRFA